MDQNLFKPTYLKQLCLDYGFSPSKAYGQNYLISSRPIEKMIDAAELSPQDTVVEIGPGFGVLTLAVAPLVKKVLTFEIEQQIRPYWEDRQKEFSNIEVVWGNALREIANHELQYPQPYKVLANLPYQITSSALRAILELSPAPERAVVMVQKEVAERICAKPGSMSLLAVSVQYYGEPKTVATVSRGSFWPSPKVDSAIVAIKNIKAHRDAAEVEQFFAVVKAGFAHKRKQAWRNIADELNVPGEKVKQALLTVAGNAKVRAEELGVGEWVKVVEYLSRIA